MSGGCVFDTLTCRFPVFFAFRTLSSCSATMCVAALVSVSPAFSPVRSPFCSCSRFFAPKAFTFNLAGCQPAEFLDMYSTLSARDILRVSVSEHTLLFHFLCKSSWMHCQVSCHIRSSWILLLFLLGFVLLFLLPVPLITPDQAANYGRWHEPPCNFKSTSLSRAVSPLGHLSHHLPVSPFLLHLLSNAAPSEPFRNYICDSYAYAWVSRITTTWTFRTGPADCTQNFWTLVYIRLPDISRDSLRMTGWQRHEQDCPEGSV